MKRSHIIGIIVGALVIAGALTAIYWPKKASVPGSTEGATEEHATEHGGEAAPTEGTGTPSHELTKAPQAPLPSSEDPKMKKIDAFIQRSHILDEFKAMDDLMESQLEQIQDQLSASDQEDLENLKKIISSEALMNDYKRMMHERFDEKSLDRLNEIYQDPTLAKVKETQIQNQSPEGQKDMIDYWKNFKESNLSPERLALLKEYDNKSGGSEATMKMIREVSRLSGGADAKDAAKFEETAKAMLPSIEKANLVQNAKNMANVSDSDMKGLNKTVSDPVFHMEAEVRQGVATGAMQKVANTVSEKEHKKDDSKKDEDHH